LEWLTDTPRRIADTAGVQKIRQYACLDREINSLGHIVDCCRDLGCIELADDDPDNIAALIEQRPATVIWLTRCRNLEKSGIVIQPLIAETLPTVKFLLVDSNPTTG